MIILYILLTVNASSKIHTQIQRLYSENPSPSSYQTLMSCMASFKQKSLSNSCFNDLQQLRESKLKRQILDELKSLCGVYNFTEEQMTSLGCSKSLIRQQKLINYKKNDIYDE